MAHIHRCHGDDAADESQQPLRLTVSRRSRADDLQQRLRVAFEHRNLVEERGVERGVRQLLVRKDMLLFTRSYARPAQDRILSRHTAELVVAHHPPQQAVVARRHLRMLVDGDGGQDRDIELEFLRIGNLRRKGRIQAVDAFHDQHIVVRQLEVLSFELACARGEVVFRNLDALAGEELFELLVQERNIQRLQALEVVISILVERRVDPVAKIVVERDDDGVQAVDPHVERQPL